MDTKLNSVDITLCNFIDGHSAFNATGHRVFASLDALQNAVCELAEELGFDGYSKNKDIQPLKLASTWVDHGQSNMVDPGRQWPTMLHHGQSWSTMPNHGSMASHGRRSTMLALGLQSSILVGHGPPWWTMASHTIR